MSEAHSHYIEFSGVQVEYPKRVTGLRNVSLGIQKGEFVFFVGKTGAGKSTVIKLITREVRPTSGTVTLQGRDLGRLHDWEIPGLRREMGIVPQDFALLPRKRVWENVAYAMRAVGHTRAEVRRKVPDILDQVNIGHRADAFPHQLSGGEQQRVAIARALINNPSLLLADEPTGNLDPERSWEIMELLKALNLKGTTILVASHDMMVVDRMDRRIVTLDGGCISGDTFTVEAGRSSRPMLDRMAFVIGEALVALRRNGFMTFAAISTVAVSLFLLGGLGYSYIRAVDYAQTIPGKFDMRVFLLPGTTPSQIADTAAKIRQIPGVAFCFLIPRDKAWAKEMKDDPANTAGLENPYPDGFKVTIRQLKDGDPVAEQLRAIPTIDPDPGVVYLKDEQHLIDDGLQVMRWLGVVIAGLLFFTAGVLIFNAIKLTITNRRREIRIMQLVGASNFTVRVPFLIEGVVQGLLGGAFAALMLFGAQHVFQNFLMTLSSRTQLSAFPYGQAVLILSGVGGAYGLICSGLAVATTRGQ